MHLPKRTPLVEAGPRAVLDFAGANGGPMYACLSHDVVAHETTHALLDGIPGDILNHRRPTGGFHEGFADIVALLSVFSLKDLVGDAARRKPGASQLIDQKP